MIPARDDANPKNKFIEKAAVDLKAQLEAVAGRASNVTTSRPSRPYTWRLMPDWLSSRAKTMTHSGYCLTRTAYTLPARPLWPPGTAATPCWKNSVTAGWATTPPFAPTNFASSATSSTQVVTSWTASTDNPSGPVAKYLVYRYSAGVTPAVIGETTGTTYTDNTVVSGVTYDYAVKAVDAAGNTSEYSNWAYVIVPESEQIPPASRAEDINEDGAVNALDFLIFKSDFGKCSGLSNPRSNIDGSTDGCVNALDFLRLKAEYGK